MNVKGLFVDLLQPEPRPKFHPVIPLELVVQMEEHVKLIFHCPLDAMVLNARSFLQEPLLSLSPPNQLQLLLHLVMLVEPVVQTTESVW